MKQIIPQTSPEYDHTRIIERPDGFYWEAREGGRVYGPFATLLEAIHDMQTYDEDDEELGESVEEAKAGAGIADRIDDDADIDGLDDPAGLHMEEQ